MAEVVQQTQHEFWRPPLQAASDAARSEMVEACDRCGTEFIVGSRFCHTCGAGRQGVTAISPAAQWREKINLAQFTTLSDKLGLTTAPLIAFLLGVLCLLGASAVGVIFSARTVLDWQAVQLWRIEWLLAAVAAFVAGCLLKKAR
jgi:hypothetical protein